MTTEQWVKIVEDLDKLADTCLGCFGSMKGSWEPLCPPCDRILARMPEDSIWKPSPYGPLCVGVDCEVPEAFRTNQDLLDAPA